MKGKDSRRVFTKNAATTIIFGLLGFGCGTSIPVTVPGPNTTNTPSPSNKVVIVANINLTVNQTYTFTATGGTQPYTYIKITGSGTITTSGIYGAFTAPSVPETDVIQVSDSNGNVATCTINITGGTTTALHISVASLVLNINQTYTFAASGGVQPYTYSAVSGTGTITTNGIFSAPGTAETDTVKVTDSAGNSDFSTITINNPGGGGGGNPTPVIISPATLALTVSQTHAFTASGGTPPYTFSMLTGTGTITTDGAYTAPQTNETDQVRVIDLNGSVSVATITVTGARQLLVNYGLNGRPPSTWTAVVCLRSLVAPGSTNNGWSWGATYNGHTYWYIGNGSSPMGISMSAYRDYTCGTPCIRWSSPSGGWVRNEDGLTCNIGVFWNSP